MESASLIRQIAPSLQAQDAIRLLAELQKKLVQGLNQNASELGFLQEFRQVEWLRNQGRDGGGVRLEALPGEFLNRASVNLSQVHYASSSHLPLASANALSSIVHPANPFAPSLHLHISWTELKSGKNYWRLMADLNPSLPDPADQLHFENALRAVKPELFDSACQQGQKYFYIPSHQRHRGISHYYLENFTLDDFEAEMQFAEAFAHAVINTYLDIICAQLTQHPRFGAPEAEQQLRYHSLYFFQVLLLDRGTTAGLLVHDQNDIGILGSLPARIDRDLFASWQRVLMGLQKDLLLRILSVLPTINPCPIDVETKLLLAQVLRAFYKEFPEALSLQAAGNILPPTIQNHGLTSNHTLTPNHPA